MTESQCVCGHRESEHPTHNGQRSCVADFGECDCTRFEWDEECPDVE